MAPAMEPFVAPLQPQPPGRSFEVLWRSSAAGPRSAASGTAAPQLQRRTDSSSEALTPRLRLSRMPTVDEFLCDDTLEPGDSASSLLVPEGYEPSAPSRPSDGTQDACGPERATVASADSWDASDDEESMAISAGSCSDAGEDAVACGAGKASQRVRAVLKRLQDGQESLADVQGKLQEMQLRVVSYVENKFEQHLSEWKGELAEEVAWQLSHALGTVGGCGPTSDEAALYFGSINPGTATKEQWVVAQEQLSREIDDLKADLAKHGRHVATIQEHLEAILASPPSALAASQQDDGSLKSAVSNACVGKLTSLEEVVGTLLQTGGSDCHLQPHSTEEEEEEMSDSCGSSSSSDSMALCRQGRLALPSCSLRAAARHGIPCLRLLPVAEQWPALSDEPGKGDDSASGASGTDRGYASAKEPACTWYVLSPRVRDAPLAPRGLAPNRCQLLPSFAAPRGDGGP